MAFLLTIGNQIANVKERGVDNEERYLSSLPQENSDIIRQYKSKLEYENSRIITAKNRWEANDTLQEYDQLVKD